MTLVLKENLEPMVGDSSLDQSGNNGSEVRFNTYSLVSRANIRELSKFNSLRSGIQVFFEISSILLFATLCEMYWNPYFYVAAVIWMGARYHAIGALTHDCVHGTLLKNRPANVVIGEILCSMVWMDFDRYKRDHLAHHQHLNGEDDPENCHFKLPEKMSSRLWIMFRPFSGIIIVGAFYEFAKYVIQILRTPSKRNTTRLLSFLALGLAVAFVPGLARMTFLYWIVPLGTWAVFVSQLRTASEHCYPNDASSPFQQSRTVNTNFFGKLLMCPNNVNHHHAHHFFPTVPWFNLPKLDKLLLEKEEYKSQYLNSSGYFSYLNDIIFARFPKEKA